MIERPMPWTVRLDADNGLGQVAAHKAMGLALDAAEQLGVGAAVVRRSNHFGAACSYSMMALPKGCIGIVTSNASTVAAPFGALEPFLGTNPLSVAVPTLKAPPFVIDMATSEGARKKVRQALSQGCRCRPGGRWTKRAIPQPIRRPPRRCYAAFWRHEGISHYTSSGHSVRGSVRIRIRRAGVERSYQPGAGVRQREFHVRSQSCRFFTG